MKSRHPIQPIETDAKGVKRFKRNAIVEYLLDNGGIDLNSLAASEIALGVSFSNEDREQFAQLIGYSVSGFGDLNFVSDETYAIAQQMIDNPGITEEQARIAYLEHQVAICRHYLKEIVPELFRVAKEDLIY